MDGLVNKSNHIFINLKIYKKVTEPKKHLLSTKKCTHEEYVFINDFFYINEFSSMVCTNYDPVLN